MPPVNPGNVSVALREVSSGAWKTQGVNGPEFWMSYLSHISWQALACSAVVSSGVTRSFLVMLTRANGGGFTGNGCVGEYHSPGTLPLGTGRSSTPNTGLPVTRSRMNM